MTSTGESLKRERDRLQQELDQANARLERAAISQLHLRVEKRTDPLTNVVTRDHLFDQISLALVGAHQGGDTPGVVMIDVNSFKFINDTHGHEVGDATLVVLADHLRAAVGPAGIVGRLGGDEFAILVYDNAHIERVVTGIAEIAETPVRLGRLELRIGITIGVAEWSGESSEAELLRHADMAMYQARADQQPIGWFNPAARALLDRRNSVSEALPAAIDAGAIQVVMQPIVELQTSRISGVEVLSRWRLNGEAVDPAFFVAVAEARGMIASFDRYLLDLAMGEATKWLLPVAPTLNLSVNVSPLSLSTEFASDLADLLERHKFNPSQLTIEVTETATIRDLRTAKQVLDDVAALGVAIALDDFGTGFSSLTYVQDLAISELKIDRSFTANLTSERKALELVRAIIQAAKALNLNVVAEGIETMEQAQLLTNMGARLGQGYLYSRPLKPAVVVPLLGRPLRPTEVSDQLLDTDLLPDVVVSDRGVSDSVVSGGVGSDRVVSDGVVSDGEKIARTSI